MLCYQCEQADRTGAVPGCAGPLGNCGKDPATADVQDLLVHSVQGIAQYASRARALGAGDDEAAGFILYSVFTTLTTCWRWASGASTSARRCPPISRRTW